MSCRPQKRPETWTGGGWSVVPSTKTARNVDGRWLECRAVHKNGPKRGRGGVGVRFWVHKGPCFSAVLKIVDAYGYYYVIIPKNFYLCVIYCA